MARGSTRPKNKISVNFKGVESRTVFPEDDYRVKLTKLVHGTSGAGNDQLEFGFTIQDGKFEGKKLPPFYCPLSENSLWKLHGLLTALGIDVPDDEMDLDLEEILEEANEIMAVVAHETYEGTKRSKMVDFYPLDEGDINEPAPKGKAKDEDEPKGKAKGKKKPALVDPDSLDGLDRDEALELIEEHGLDTDPDDFPKLAKLIAAIRDELEEKGLLEGAEEPEEPKGKGGDKEMTDAEKRKARREARKAKAGGDAEEPKGKTTRKGKVADDEDEESKGKKSSKKAKDQISADDVMDKDEDELQELIDEHDLEVDLDDYKTLRKKASAVIDALTDAGLLADD